MAKAFILVAIAAVGLAGCAKEAEPAETPAPATTQAKPPAAAQNSAPASFKGNTPQVGQAVPNTASNGMPTSGELSVNPNAKK